MRAFSCCVEGLLSCGVDGSVESFVFVVKEAEAVEGEWVIDEISLGRLMKVLTRERYSVSI